MVVANRLALAGLAAVILLVTDVLFSTLTTGIATVLAATMFGGLWFVAPARRRLALSRERSRPPRQPSSRLRS